MQQSPARSVRYPRAAPFPRPSAVPQARLRLYSRARLLAPRRCRFHMPRPDPPTMPATHIPARLVEDEAPSIAVHLLPLPSTALHLLLSRPQLLEHEAPARVVRVDEDRLRVAVADAHCEVGVTPRAERAVPAHPRIALGTLARADSAAKARRKRRFAKQRWLRGPRSLRR